MRKPWFLSLWISFLMLSALLVAARAIAASPAPNERLPLRTPELPVERLGLLSPYAILGAAVDGAALAAENAVDDIAIEPRGTITERMTLLAQGAGEASPYHDQMWLTYYGRPGIPVMGILAEYSIDELIGVLEEQVRAYEHANGRELSVQPAFHLVYGMATRAPGDDGDHLDYLADEIVMEYITKAAETNLGVILDIQIGALSPVESISKALPYLEYEHVHLAIDPEFVMAHPGQTLPGDPIGYVTAEQVNEVQASIQSYLRRNRIKGERVLLVHQFQANMILEPEKIDHSYEQVAVTISVDGWGDPWSKITKYNSLVTPESPFVAFKLFYRWDEPILTPEQALGEEWDPGTEMFIDVTPNMIIYQ